MKLALLTLSLAVTAAAQTFVLGGGCPLVHCSPNGDNVLLSAITPPISDVSLIMRTSGYSGVLSGVGCTSNGVVAACNQITGFPHVTVFDGSGAVQYTTGTVVGPGNCPAMIGSDNGIIVADEANIYRFAPSTSGGAIAPMWTTPLPYAGFPSASNSSGSSPTGYLCGDLALTSLGYVVVLAVNGPMAAFNATTGCVVGASGCGGSCTGANCALWPGLGSYSSSAAYYCSTKEGAGYNSNSIYRAVVGTGSGSCGGSGAAAEIMMRFDVASSGITVGNQSTQTYANGQGASTNIETFGGSTKAYFDSGSTGSGLTSAMNCLIDNTGSGGFTTCSGFPLTTAVITATNAPLAISSITWTSNIASVNVGSGNGTKFTVGQAGSVVGTSSSPFNSNFLVHAVSSSVVQLATSVNPGSLGAGGTVQPNNAGIFHSGYSFDATCNTSAGGLWLYVSGNPGWYCIATSGANIGTVQNTLNVSAMAGSPLQGTSLRTVYTNPANSHNILIIGAQTATASQPSYVIAMDTTTGSLLWAVLLATATSTNNMAGQVVPTVFNGYTRLFGDLSNAGPMIFGTGGATIP